MRSIDDFRNRSKSASSTALAARSDALRPLAQETVRVDALTGDEHWDHFLSYLEAALKESRRHLELQRQMLGDPAMVNDEKIRLIKGNIAQSEARIWTLDEIILLPKRLKEQSSLAKAQIAEMTRDA